MAGLNMRKESKLFFLKEGKFLDRRANRIQLTSFIAHIYRRSDIRIIQGSA
jgi:hypothetical protein